MRRKHTAIVESPVCGPRARCRPACPRRKSRRSCGKPTAGWPSAFCAQRVRGSRGHRIRSAPPRSYAISGLWRWVYAASRLVEDQRAVRVHYNQLQRRKRSNSFFTAFPAELRLRDLAECVMHPGWRNFLSCVYWQRNRKCSQDAVCFSTLVRPTASG
jgi:hypothetical protein